MRSSRPLYAILLAAFFVASPASAETFANKAKTLNDSAKKAFDEAAKEHTAAMKSLEDAGASESKADAKWHDASRFAAEARRYEPQIDAKLVQAERLRKRADRLEDTAKLDERMANNLEARAKREAANAATVRDDAVALRKLAKGEKDTKLKDRFELSAKLDDDLAKDMDKESARFKTLSETLRKEAKSRRTDAEKLVEEAHKLDGK